MNLNFLLIFAFCCYVHGSYSIVATHKTNPVAFFGLYEGAKLAPQSWTIFDRTVNWAIQSGNKNAIDVWVATYNGGTDHQNSKEQDCTAFVNRLSSAGFRSVKVVPESDIDIETDFAAYGLLVYTYVSNYPVSAIVTSGKPFITFSPQQAIQLGIGTLDTRTVTVSTINLKYHPINSGLKLGKYNLGGSTMIWSVIHSTDASSAMQVRGGDCVGSWGPYTFCTKNCGTGVKTRTYVVLSPGTGLSLPCDAANGGTQSTSCNTQQCPGWNDGTPPVAYISGCFLTSAEQCAFELNADWIFYDAEFDLQAGSSLQWCYGGAGTMIPDSNPDEADSESSDDGSNYHCASSCVPIPGATSSTYVLTPGDVGKTISLMITPRAATGKSPGQCVLGCNSLIGNAPPQTANCVDGFASILDERFQPLLSQNEPSFGARKLQSVGIKKGWRGQLGGEMVGGEKDRSKPQQRDRGGRRFQSPQSVHAPNKTNVEENIVPSNFVPAKMTTPKSSGVILGIPASIRKHGDRRGA